VTPAPLGDSELAALFTHKLVQAHSTTAVQFGLFQWQANEVGKVIVRRRDAWTL
jgi:hypothetical protein